MVSHCPQCKNKGFKKSADVPYQSRTYKVTHYCSGKGKITHRYRICTMCGFKWVTEEKYLRNVNTEYQPGLFDKAGHVN